MHVSPACARSVAVAGAIADDRRRPELGDLFSAARSHNKKNGITGALLLFGDTSVQTLDGDEEKVQALLARIQADPRHESIEVLDTSLVADRVFARWVMAKSPSTIRPTSRASRTWRASTGRHTGAARRLSRGRAGHHAPRSA